MPDRNTATPPQHPPQKGVAGERNRGLPLRGRAPHVAVVSPQQRGPGTAVADDRDVLSPPAPSDSEGSTRARFSHADERVAYVYSDLFAVRIKAKKGTFEIGEARTMWHGLGEVAVRVTVD